MLHVIAAEMSFSGEQPLPVDNPVSGYVLRASVHRPTYHPRRLRRSEISCNSAVSGHSTIRHKTNYLINMLKTKRFQNSKIPLFRYSVIHYLYLKLAVNLFQKSFDVLAAGVGNENLSELFAGN